MNLKGNWKRAKNFTRKILELEERKKTFLTRISRVFPFFVLQSLIFHQLVTYSFYSPCQFSERHQRGTGKEKSKIKFGC